MGAVTATKPLPREKWAREVPDYAGRDGALRLLKKLREKHPTARFWLGPPISTHDGAVYPIRSDLRL